MALLVRKHPEDLKSVLVFTVFLENCEGEENINIYIYIYNLTKLEKKISGRSLAKKGKPSL